MSAEIRDRIRHIISACIANPSSDQIETATDHVLDLFGETRKPMEQRRSEFIEELRPFVELMGKDEANKFAKHWLEKSINGRKFRFEKEKTFDVARRVETWMRNSEKFKIVNMLKR